MRNSLALLAAIIAIHSLAACTSKEEKENLQRTNDGTETFKFDPSEVPGFCDRSPTHLDCINKKERKTLPKAHDVTEGFEFDPSEVPGFCDRSPSNPACINKKEKQKKEEAK